MLQEQDRQKLDGIVQQMVANNESDANIQFVVDDFKKKYGKSEQPQQSQKDAVYVPDFIKSATAPFAQQTANTMAAKEAGQQGTASSLFQIGGNVVSSAFAPLTEGVKRAFNMLPEDSLTRKAISGAGSLIEKGIETSQQRGIGLGAITDIPAVQRFAASPFGETTARSVEAGQGYLNLIPSPKGIGTIAKGTEGALSRLETVVGTPEARALESFNTNLNKAFPVLKKDVGSLTTKQRNARIAFADIVNNQDKIKIYDEAGNIKSPENYNFVDTVDAQQQRLPQIYKEYTSRLSTVDNQKFQDGIKTGIKNTIDHLDADLLKENSVDGRRALTKIKGELSSLRDTSPEGIQSYIESINRRIKPAAPGGALTEEQVKLVNIAGGMRDLLDSSIEKLDGKGYQDLRNTYAAHKAIQSQLLQAAKSELNKTPGWTDRLTNIGMTGEGINFLLTHDPHSLAVAAGLKASNSYIKWLRSPQRALQNMFKDVQRINPSPRNPSTMNHSANISPTSNNITTDVTTLSPEVQRIIQMSQ